MMKCNMMVDGMRDIVLSIKPEYCERILSRVKFFEYRRKIPKAMIDKAYIYCSSPVSKVVGVGYVTCIVEADLESLWHKTNDFNGDMGENKLSFGGITKEQFDKYFKGCKKGYAIHFGVVKQFKTPKDISEFGLKKAPQSFAYVNNN